MQDPRKGEGWEFTLDENKPWYKGLQTRKGEDGERYIDIKAYDEFGNIQELVNFIRGEGSYSNRRPFTPGQQDIEDKKRELQNDVWKLPTKIEEIKEYLESGAMRGEVDLDPTAKAEWEITETEARMQDKDTKYTAHFYVYDPEEASDGSVFYIAGSWYDTEPGQMNVEDIFESLFGEN